MTLLGRDDQRRLLREELRKIKRWPPNYWEERTENLWAYGEWIGYKSLPYLVKCMINRDWSVCVYRCETVWGQVLQVQIQNHDSSEVRVSWSQIQAIKDRVVGPEWLALEVYPASSKVVDQANVRWLWVLPPGAALPFDLGMGVGGKHS